MCPKNMGKHIQLWPRESNNEMQITCQNNNPKRVYTNYIYLYFAKKKKDKPCKTDLPFL